MSSLIGRPLLALGGILLLVSLGVPASAQRRAPPEGGFPPGLAEARMVKSNAETLGLDEKTVAKLDALIEEVKEQEEALREKTGEARKAIQELLDQNKPSEKSLMEASGNIAKLASQAREAKLRCTLKVRKLLTDEQLAEFMKLREEQKTAGRRGMRRRR